MNILDVLEIGNTSQTEVDKWKEEFEEQFMKPINDLALVAIAQQLMAQPEEVQERLKQNNPEQYNKLKELGGM